MTGGDVRRHIKVESPSTFYKFLAERLEDNVDAKHLEQILIDLLVDSWEIVIDMLGHLEVEEDVDAAETEVVEETEEEDTDRSWHY